MAVFWPPVLDYACLPADFTCLRLLALHAHKYYSWGCRNSSPYLLKSEACGPVYFIYLLCLVPCFPRQNGKQQWTISRDQQHHWPLALVPRKPVFPLVPSSFLCGIIWSPSIRTQDITVGKIIRLYPKIALCKSLVTHMKGPVLCD